MEVEGRMRQRNRAETLKLPGQLDEEREQATNRNSVQLRFQMKEITKCRKRHSDELKQMRDKLKLEFVGMTTKNDGRAANLEKLHANSLKDLLRETEQESHKMQKQHTSHKKKVDELMKKALSTCRTHFMSQLKTKLSLMKKEHKAFKETKQQIVDLLDSVKTKETSQFEGEVKRCLDLEAALLHAKQAIVVIEHNMASLAREFELREQHLEEKVTLETEHRTGLRFDMERFHILQLQEKQTQQQQERHALILHQHEDTFKFELDVLHKHHTSASKKLKSSLKKMPVMHEEVVAIFERRTTVHGKSTSPVKESSSLRSRLSVHKIPPTQRRELKHAKEEHVKTETVKLSEAQMKSLNAYRTEKELEVELLKELNNQEAKALQATFKQKLAEFDAKGLTMKESTNTYIIMQKNSFSMLREQRIKKPEAKAKKKLNEHTTVTTNTKEELRELYTGVKAFDSIRPKVLNVLSMIIIR